MFFTPTLKSDWFYTHKAFRCLMVILMLSTAIIPIFYFQEDADAILPAIGGAAIAKWGIPIAAAGVGGLFVYLAAEKKKPCNNPECDIKLKNPGTDHLETCSHCLTGAWAKCPVNNGVHPHMTQCNEANCGVYYYHCVDARPDSPNKGKTEYEYHKPLNYPCGAHTGAECDSDEEKARHQSKTCQVEGCGATYYDCLGHECPIQESPSKKCGKSKKCGSQSGS